MHGIQRIPIKMTNEEIENAYNEMVEMWGDRLPNPEHEPLRFAYYVRMWKYYKEKNNVE
jgi:hypothetical protein